MYKLLKIFSYLLLMAVLTESVSGIWIKPDNNMVLMEKEEKGDAKVNDTEKQDAKDKLFGSVMHLENTADKKSLFILDNIYIRNSVYLSLPEIPPKLA